MPDFAILRDDGLVVVEPPAGRRLRWLPPDERPAGHENTPGGVWVEVESSGPTPAMPAAREDAPVVPSGPNGTMTRAKARRHLRGAGIHPYPQDVDQYMKTRRLRPEERARHQKKVADKVREQLRLDEQVRRGVEGGEG